MHKLLRMSIAVLLAAIVGYFVFFSKAVSFEALKLSAAWLTSYVDENYTQAVILYVLMYAAGVTFSLPIATVFTLAGGFMFGAWYGGFYALLGATAGATLCFLLVRYLVGDFVQKRYAQQLTALNNELKQRGAYYLLSLRFFAVIPFFIINLVAGLSPIALTTFILTTAVGILPGAFVYAYAGQSLASLESPADIMSPQILIAFGLLGVLALLPILFQKKKKLQLPSTTNFHNKKDER